MAGILDISHIFLYKTKKETILEQGRSREPKTKIYETLRTMQRDLHHSRCKDTLFFIISK